MNRKKVLRIMKKYNIQAEYIKKAKIKHKNKRIEENVQPNLLNRNFTTDTLNKVWDTDVTYLIFNGSRAYLSTIIDLYDRRVISYVISKKRFKISYRYFKSGFIKRKRCIWIDHS